MFLHVSVILFTGRGHVRWGGCMAGGVHGRGACVAGGCVCGRGHAWQGTCMLGGCIWYGVCVAGGMYGWGDMSARGGVACVVGGHAWQERRPLQRTVRILLECVLVFVCRYTASGRRRVCVATAWIYPRCTTVPWTTIQNRMTTTTPITRDRSRYLSSVVRYYRTDA